MKKGAQKGRGFTVIEVSLVLAIAGLIFLMVFITFPTLQRNQRDAKRRSDMMELEAAIEKYQSNNRGMLPSLNDGLAIVTSYTDADAANSWAGFYRDYLPDPFKDPSGGQYVLKVAKCGATAGSCTGKAAEVLAGLTDEANQYNVAIIVQATCNNEEAVGTANPRKLAILYKLEGGGIYCGSI